MAFPKFKPPIPRRTLEEIQRQGKWTFNSRLNYASYSVRYALYNVVPPGLRWLVPFIEEDIKDLFKPESQDETAAAEISVAEKENTQIPSASAPIYEKYRCPYKNPLQCQEPQRTITDNPQAKACLKCGFPALLPTLGEIQGKRGRYRIEGFLYNRGFGRIYSGIELGEEKPIIIQEYLLPKRFFNEKEGIEVQITFENVAGLSLADGRLQSGRIADVIEAIADRDDRERCYLITKINPSITLRTYIDRNGAMSSRQTLHFLNQSLQSLEYLHGQKFRLPNGQIQAGLAHGNLSLDSILISTQEEIYFHDPQFLVYLWDLALWESLFDPVPNIRVIPTPSQDLKALGLVAFYLLSGGDDRISRWRDPKVNQSWGKTDINLKRFLFHLLELDTPFTSATEARRALPTLLEEEESEVAPDELTVSENKSLGYWWRWLLLLMVLSLLGGGLTWWLFRRQVAVANSNIPTCCISSVFAVPSGKFTYTAEKKGIWNYILQQPDLIQKDKTLEEELTARRPELHLKYWPQPTGEEAIAQVRAEKVDFAISSLTSNLSDDLNSQIFAYDGITFYVAFSYEKRDRSLPKYLNGRISLTQLQQLYTGQISNWQQLGGPDLPVRLYIPTSAETIRIFEERVLRDRDMIAQFREMVVAQSQAQSLVLPKNTPQIVQSPTIKALREIQQDFENEQIGAIGFGAISQVFGQCSVYPLAVGNGEGKPFEQSNDNFVQPLIQDNGQTIDPSTDLCSKKGGYHLNYQVFQNGSYSLAYPIAVIFRRDNRKEAIGDRFAEILKTQETQCLLTNTGIVPLPIDYNQWRVKAATDCNFELIRQIN